MAKAEKEPHQLAGKVLTTGSCPECKKPVTIKANRNGVAYFYCHERHPATGEQCNHHGRLSTRLSAKLCIAYLKQPTPGQALDHANDNRPPKEAVEASRG